MEVQTQEVIERMVNEIVEIAVEENIETTQKKIAVETPPNAQRLDS